MMNLSKLLHVALALVLASGLSHGQAPGAEYTSLLDGVKVSSTGRSASAGGVLTLDELFGVFLPPEALFDGGALKKSKNQCYAVLRRTAEGPELDRWTLLNEPFNSVFTKLRPVGRPMEFVFEQAGGYVLSIQLDDRVLSELPFEVRFVKSGDPFNPALETFIDGPWSQLACLRLGDLGGAEGTASLKLWLRGGVFNESGKDETVEVEVRNEGRTVFTSLPIVLRKSQDMSTWHAYRQDLLFTRGDGGGLVKNKDLYKKDGVYDVVLRRGDKLQGHFRFEIRAGKPVPNERSAFDRSPRGDYLCSRSPLGSGGVQTELVWMRRVGAEAGASALASGPPAAVLPSAAERAAWIVQPSAPAERPFKVFLTDAKARMDAGLAVGDDVILFGTGAARGVAYMTASDGVLHKVPSGAEWSSSLFGVCGKKLILTRGSEVAVFDTETQRLFEIPPEEISLVRSYAPFYGARPLGVDGMLVATLNSTKAVNDRRSIKVIDVSGETPRILALLNPDADAGELTAIAVEAASGKIAVAWNRGAALFAGDVADGGSLLGFDVSGSDGIGRTSPLLVAGGRAFYFDATGTRRMNLVEIAAGRIVPLAPLGRDGRFFAATATRYAFMSDQSLGSNFAFAITSLPAPGTKGGIKLLPAPNVGQAAAGNANLGMGSSVAITPGGLVFLAGQGKSGIGSGEVLGVHDGTHWSIVAGPDGAAISAVDVVAGERLIAFKTGNRNDTRIGYAVFGQAPGPDSIPHVKE